MKNSLFFFLFSVFALFVQAQQKDCQFFIQGKLIDADTYLPVSNAHLEINNFSSNTSNHKGEFVIQKVCLGEIKLKISHIAYSELNNTIALRNDTTLTIYLHKKSIDLDVVNIQANVSDKKTQSERKISSDLKFSSQGKNLAEVLTTIDGVSVLKTGSNISKPVLNGLYGNRLLLIQNGVRHESQQWGAEHAPEIDPFAGQNILVIKNSDGVRYGPDALAGIIKINPAPIDSTKTVKGSTALILNSNGRGGIWNTQLEGGLKNFTYRVGTTLKRSGNLKTANYYLGNTGVEELNSNVILNYNGIKHAIQFSFTNFSTNLGIFDGAHIGNKEDIIERIKHGRPFEKYQFSYKIAAPNQKVDHQVAKVNYQYKLINNATLEMQYSLQRNHRREFDMRRVLDDNVPMADMILTTQHLELVYTNPNSIIGLAGTLQVNNNTPGTGTTPIIPNFDNHTFGAFASHKISMGRKQLEFGIRYDYKYFDVAGYRYDYTNPNPNGSLNQYLLKDQKHFNNISAVTGLSIPFSKFLLWKTNAGLAWRAPSANELYSDGIHHGSGTYEVGNKNLKSEKGLKWVNSIQLNNNFIHASVDLFAQVIQDYIYSQPNPDSTRQTIRGTFPLFQFKQNDAFFYGLDYNMQLSLAKNWNYDLGIAIVRAKNTETHKYFPYIPADRYRHSIAYNLPISKIWKSSIKVEQIVQAKQSQYESDSDFAPPPPSYQLFNLIVGTYISHKSQKNTRVQLSVENLFNKEYKDYMDRFRYYAHALGRNISIKINHTF